MTRDGSAQTFDFIVVGAGSAGCVLANRLTKDGSAQVLVVEAGSPDVLEDITIPVAFPRLQQTEIDWQFFSEAEPELESRRLYLPRGKTLGGSSAINAMIYTRGCRQDFDEWRDLGNPGWGFDDVLPYFIRSEDNERGPSPYHGVGGPLAVSDTRSRNRLCSAFIEAAVEWGLPVNEDFNGPQSCGVAFYQVNQRDGRRCSAADAFLRPALPRSNLTVFTGCHATRLLFDRLRVVGIEVMRQGRMERLRAESEVIVSAGAYGSPQLLLLSGIGSASDLRAAGIPVTIDSPAVGSNLQDHPGPVCVWIANAPISLLDAESPAHQDDFRRYGRGPMTSNIAESGGFCSVRTPSELPDVQLHMRALMWVDEGIVRPNLHGYTIGPTLLKPLSRGRVSLRSADSSAPPRIEVNFLAEQEDLATTVDGLRLAIEIAGMPALAHLTDGAFRTPASAATSDLVEHVRATTQTKYHPVGTCAMGGDAAVTACDLRVRGVDGLRVIDASIMPTIPRANTHAATVMIAEKGADFITSTWTATNAAANGPRRRN
jgi:choline dehydrogenase